MSQETIQNTEKQLKQWGVFIGGCAGSGQPRGIKNLRWEGYTLRKDQFDRRRSTHTTSVALALGDSALFIDVGTGILDVIEFILSLNPKAVYGALTHEHKDHISDMHRNDFITKYAALLKAFYLPRLLEAASGESLSVSFKFWPIGPEVMPKPKLFVPGGPLDMPIEGVKVRTMLQAHGFDVTRKVQAFSAGYRIETPFGAIVFATDHEIHDEDEKYLDTCAEFWNGAKYVIGDFQYREGEFEGHLPIGKTKMPRKGFGHSTPVKSYAVARRCPTPPEVILMTHTDPEYEEKDRIEHHKETQHLFSEIGVKVELAVEGRYHSLIAA